MLTDAQVVALSAINDYCEIHGRLNLNPNGELPPLIAEQVENAGLMPSDFLLGAADLKELGLIRGVNAMQARHPVVIFGLTATGRQELP